MKKKNGKKEGSSVEVPSKARQLPRRHLDLGRVKNPPPLGDGKNPCTRYNINRSDKRQKKTETETETTKKQKQKQEKENRNRNRNHTTPAFLYMILCFQFFFHHFPPFSPPLFLVFSVFIFFWVFHHFLILLFFGLFHFHLFFWFFRFPIH